jgi:hypothetical protein
VSGAARARIAQTHTKRNLIKNDLAISILFGCDDACVHAGLRDNFGSSLSKFDLPVVHCARRMGHSETIRPLCMKCRLCFHWEQTLCTKHNRA